MKFKDRLTNYFRKNRPHHIRYTDLGGIRDIVNEYDPSQILILDTETTGLDHKTDEIIQITIMDYSGNVLFYRNIRPREHAEWPEASQLNGIYPAMIHHEPYITFYTDELNEILANAKALCAYNAEFDINFLYREGLKVPHVPVFDIMHAFAEIYGDYSEKYKAYKWKKLSVCAAYYDYEWNGRIHDSKADCGAELYCMKKMIESES